MAFPAFNLGNKEDLPVCVCGCLGGSIYPTYFLVLHLLLVSNRGNASGCKELAPNLDEIHSEKQICIFIYKDTLQRILSFLLELQYLVSSANLYLIISEFCRLRYGEGDHQRFVFACIIVLNPFDKGGNFCG